MVSGPPVVLLPGRVLPLVPAGALRVVMPWFFKRSNLSFPESPSASWSGATADQGTCPEFLVLGTDSMPASQTSSSIPPVISPRKC